jgi:hypothetical protein
MTPTALFVEQGLDSDLELLWSSVHSFGVSFKYAGIEPLAKTDLSSLWA